MVYQLTYDGKIVKRFYTNAQIVEYMTRTHPNIKGFSEASIKRKKLTGHPDNELMKGGYTLKFINVDKKRKTPNKITSKRFIRHDIYKRNNTLDHKEYRISYKRGVLYNEDDSNSLIKFIMDYIQRLPNVRNSSYNVVFVGKEDIGENNVDLTPVMSTKGGGYNATYKNLVDLLQAYFNKYDGGIGMNLQHILIQERALPRAEHQIIFKNLESKNMTKSDIINDLQERLKYEDIESVEFINLFIKFKFFVSPNTYENCMIKSIIMGYYNKETVTTECENYIKLCNLEFSKTILDCELICETSFEHFGTHFNITVYHIGDTIQKYEYGIADNHMYDKIKRITLCVKCGHTYLMTSDKDFKINDEARHIEKGINDDVIKKPKDKEPVILKIATYDMETCDSGEVVNGTYKKTTPYAIGYYNGFTYTEFYKYDMSDNVIDKFLNFINNIENDTVIYAHNGGKFDTVLLLPAILMKEYMFITDYLESNGRILTLNITNKKKCRISFRDSINFICMSLDSACDSFKTATKKLTGTVIHDDVNIYNSYINSKIKVHKMSIVDYTAKYLKNDCVCLHEMINIFDSVIFNTYKFHVYDTLTNAGIARKHFLDTHYDEIKKPIYYLTDKIDSELRQYYFGGRNEVLTSIGEYKGSKPLFYVDFTSLYPYVMQKYDYSYDKLNIIDIPIEDENKFNDKWFGFVKCVFRNTNHNNQPLHAVKGMGKLLFPYVDNWTESIISTEEIKYSIKYDLGYEYKFKKVYNYEKHEPIFQGMITTLFKMKSDAETDGDEALRTIAKIIINSSYGFWGTNYKDRDQSIIYDTSKLSEKHKAEVFEQKYFGYLNDNKLKSYKQHEHYDLYQITDRIKPNSVNVGLASMICSNARIELYNLMRMIKSKGGNVFYCDTDSVITDCNIYSHKDICKEFVKKDKANIGELTNEAKGCIKKLLKKDGLDADKILKGKQPIFTELITCGNKAYYMKTEFEYKNKIYSKEIIKMKGINTKSKYKKRFIDKTAKVVSYRYLDGENGSFSFCKDDYLKMCDGWVIECDDMTFKSGFKGGLMDGNGLLKIENSKGVKLLYDKSEVYDECKLKPLVI